MKSAVRLVPCLLAVLLLVGCAGTDSSSSSATHTPSHTAEAEFSYVPGDLETAPPDAGSAEATPSGPNAGGDPDVATTCQTFEERALEEEQAASNSAEYATGGVFVSEVRALADQATNSDLSSWLKSYASVVDQWGDNPLTAYAHAGEEFTNSVARIMNVCSSRGGVSIAPSVNVR